MRLTTDRLMARLESAVEKSDARQRNGKDISGFGTKVTAVELEGKELLTKPVHEAYQMTGKFRQLTALNKLSLQMQRQTSIDILTQEAVRILEDDLGYRHAAIYLVENDSGRLKRYAISKEALEASELERGIIGNTRPLRPGTSITSWVAQTGRPVCIGDVSLDPRYRGSVEEIRSALCVPMRVTNRVVGVVTVESSKADAYKEDDQVIMEMVASQVALAIHNTRLAAKVKKLAAKKKIESGPLTDEQEEIIYQLQRENEELSQINSTLLAQNQELNAFSHTVAHDLKNPLAILLGFAEVLGQDYVSGEDELLGQGIQVILENGLRLESIIDELLLLAEVRQLDEIDLEPISMEAIVSETRKRLSNLIDESEAKIIFPVSWPITMGHKPWVQEVWVNYVSNAIKYGGRPPEIELGAVKQADGMVRFWVLDNGPGISLEDQRRLFVPFTKLYQVRAQGHGLGLSIVRRIVTKLGGEVGVNSVPGEGSKFWFTLPLVRDLTDVEE
ncbi:MAG: hypothetical protein BMS9Abin02_0240 [Anaerolineae bacterium]|nr:MAG: hypothetical protein BMS9Abin02_0240 [Anaerolineae bacterium]